MHFAEFRKLREEAEEPKGTPDSKEPKLDTPQVSARITLGDGNDYKPFIVSDNPASEHQGQNENLAPIIKAFKTGAIWGWTKDKDGTDKPVKISGKKLYLSGGSVRDILKGKTPKNMELTTDATPSEIKRILRQSLFKAVGDEGGSGDSNRTFEPKEKTKKGEPVSFVLTVNGEKFDLNCFRRDPHGSRSPETGTHGEDAKRRDLTMNSLYLLLSNDDGPNKEIVDFHGGIHDLNSGKARFVDGDVKKKSSKAPSED